MSLEEKVNKILNLAFTSLGAAYTIGTVYLLYNTIAKPEPIETKVKNIAFSTISGFIGYHLLKKD